MGKLRSIKKEKITKDPLRDSISRTLRYIFPIAGYAILIGYIVLGIVHLFSGNLGSFETYLNSCTSVMCAAIFGNAFKISIFSKT